MTEVEGNFCNKNEDKNRSCEFTLNTSQSFFSKRLLAKIVKKILDRVVLGSTVSGWLGWLGVVMFYWGKTFFWLIWLINFFNRA